MVTMQPTPLELASHATRHAKPVKAAIPAAAKHALMASGMKRY
jgi:hypothetical protein